jgi:glycosyltransferase involved in cell wall biosynthesis
MRICLVYDCLYPHTIGGAERMYREVGARLVAEGHQVTYLTMRQWDRGADASYDGVRVVAAGPRMALYDGDGKRRLEPPLVFGLGVLWHLLRHGRSYDVVQTISFPYFSVLAIALLRPAFRWRVVVDWFEVWTLDYWREYLGRVGGRIGWAVQRLCARVPQTAFCFSRLHARRLREEGLRGQVTVLEGAYPERLEPGPVADAEPLVVFAGRHIPEKRVPAIVPAIELLRERRPEADIRCVIFGDGPERPAVLEAIAASHLDGAVEAPGFVERERVEDALRHALCMVLPSKREGYGLVVVEASARGTPSVVVRDADNAATELVDEGENGFIAASASAEDLAAAIERVADAGPELRERTAAWFARNERRLSLDSSLDELAGFYAAGDSARS